MCASSGRGEREGRHKNKIFFSSQGSGGRDCLSTLLLSYPLDPMKAARKVEKKQEQKRYTATRNGSTYAVGKPMSAVTLHSSPWYADVSTHGFETARHSMSFLTFDFVD